MTGIQDNDWWDSIPNPFRWLILGALLSSVGSGIVNLDKDTSDRYKGADAARDFALRDQRIEAVARAVEKHDAECEKNHADYEARLRRIEREIADHHLKD